MASSSFETAVHPMMTLAEKYTDGACKHTIGKKMDRFRPVGRVRKADIAEKLDRKARQKAQTVRRSKQRASFFEEHVGVIAEMPSKKAETLAFEKALDEEIAALIDYHFWCDCGPHNAQWDDWGYDYLAPSDLCYNCVGRLAADGTLRPHTKVSDKVRVYLPSGSFVIRVTLNPPPLRQKAIEAAAAYAKTLHRN